MMTSNRIGWAALTALVALSLACGRTHVGLDGGATTSGNRGEQGLESMKQKNWVEENLRRSSEDQVSGIANTLASDLREPVRSATQLWMSPDSAMSRKAMTLLLSIDELAIAPLTEVDPATPADKVWAMRMAVDAELALRKKMIARMDALLDDKTPIPMAKPPRAEQVPPPRRVCDEAYLLMRTVVHFGEDQVTAQAEASFFLDLTDAEKDVTIQKARSSGIWNRVLGGEDGNE